MALTIGRVGHPTAGQVSLGDPADVQLAGAGIMFAGTVTHLTSLADAQALRAQIVGLQSDDDEPIVPVTWTEDPTIDGYYRVVDATADLGEASLCEFVLDWSVQVERVHGHQAAAVDSILSTVLVPTTPAIGTVTAQDNLFYAIQGDALDWSPGQAGGTVTSVLTATGFLARRRGGHSISANYYPGWAVRPASYYQGACTIEANANFRPVVGDVPGWDNLATSARAQWRMSNGLMRVSTDPVSFTQLLRFSHWDGTQWDPEKTFRITCDGVDMVLSAPRIVRNTPEVCIMRFVHGGSLLTFGRITCDVEIRRGARGAMFRFTADIPKQFAVIDDVGASYTAVTNGMRETANSAGGNRYWMTMAQAYTATLGTGVLTSNSALPRCQLGIGAEVPGGSLNPEDAQAHIYGLWAMALPTDRVVAR